MKRFFGGVFIEKEKLQETGIYHPIKLEYYKEINEDKKGLKNVNKYGIQIVKTEYKSDNIKIEKKSIKNLTDDEDEENKILKMFRDNQVTIINFEEVLIDFFNAKNNLYNAEFEVE